MQPTDRALRSVVLRTLRLLASNAQETSHVTSFPAPWCRLRPDPDPDPDPVATTGSSERSRGGGDAGVDPGLPGATDAAARAQPTFLQQVVAGDLPHPL